MNSNTSKKQENDIVFIIDVLIKYKFIIFLLNTIIILGLLFIYYNEKNNENSSDIFRANILVDIKESKIASDIRQKEIDVSKVIDIKKYSLDVTSDTVFLDDYVYREVYENCDICKIVFQEFQKSNTKNIEDFILSIKAIISTQYIKEIIDEYLRREKFKNYNFYKPQINVDNNMDTIIIKIELNNFKNLEQLTSFLESKINAKFEKEMSTLYKIIAEDSKIFIDQSVNVIRDINQNIERNYKYRLTKLLFSLQSNLKLNINDKNTISKINIIENLLSDGLNITGIEYNNIIADQLIKHKNDIKISFSKDQFDDFIDVNSSFNLLTITKSSYTGILKYIIIYSVFFVITLIVIIMIEIYRINKLS